MKDKIIRIRVALVLAVIAVMLIANVGTVFAAKPTTITVHFNQAQDQWRGSAPYEDGWTYNYQESATWSDFVLTGNVLHGLWTYQPHVDDEEGSSTVYVYDKKSELWIEKEGTVSYIYKSGYGNYTVFNYFRSYLNFGGSEPDTANFVEGLAYQWVYIYELENVDITGAGAYTVEPEWDETMGAWLVGFSIYRWDPVALPALTAPVPFPNPYPEPVPANVYNPLDL